MNEARRITNCPHTERPHYAKGMCHSCYVLSKKKEKGEPVEKAKRVRIRYQRPAVADHVAKAFIKHNMDTEEAVAQDLAPELAESPARVAEVAQMLENAPQVKQAVERNLRAKGLDEQSKNVFVEELWDWMLNQNDKRAIAAARILGRGFIGEKVGDGKPIKLEIEGFGEGLQRMLGGAGAQAEATDTTTTEPAGESDEQTEEEEESSDGEDGFPTD